MDCTCSRSRHKHGTEAAYTSDRCRCFPCCIARHRYVTAWKAGQPRERRTAPIIGTRRRLRALTAMGWSPPELAERTGMNEQVLRRLRRPERSNPRYGDDATVLLCTHHLIAALYDELWDTPSPGPKAATMRGMARRHGWLPPMGWDDDDIDQASDAAASTLPVVESVDEVAVAEAVAGRAVPLNRTEMTGAVAKLTAMGFSAAEISDRLGINTRLVTRRRAARRKEAA